MIKQDSVLIEAMKQTAQEEFSELEKESESSEHGIVFSEKFNEKMSKVRLHTRKIQRRYYILDVNRRIAALCGTILVFFILNLSMNQLYAADNSDIYLHFDSYLKHIEARSCTYFKDGRFFSKKIKTSDRYVLKNVPESLELIDATCSTSFIRYCWKSRDKKQHLRFGQYDPTSFSQSWARSTVFAGSTDINDKLKDVHIYRNVEYGGGYIVWIYDGYCFMLDYAGFSEEEILLRIKNDVVKE